MMKCKKCGKEIDVETIKAWVKFNYRSEEWIGVDCPECGKDIMLEVTHYSGKIEVED